MFPVRGIILSVGSLEPRSVKNLFWELLNLVLCCIRLVVVNFRIVCTAQNLPFEVSRRLDYMTCNLRWFRQKLFYVNVGANISFKIVILFFISSSRYEKKTQRR